MRAHMEAVAKLLAPLGRAVYLGDADSKALHAATKPDTNGYPRFVIWGPPGALEDDTQDGRQDTINDVVGVNGAAATYADALDLMRVARERLLRAVPVVNGWSTNELRLVESRPVQLDRDVRMPSGAFPAFGSDSFALISEPLT